MKLDDWLLKATDRFGDWYQEERGGVLPKLLYAITYVVVFTEAFWALAFIPVLYREPSVAMSVVVGIWIVVFGLANLRTPQVLREFQSDFDRFEDEKVRKRYEDAALKSRYLRQPLRLWLMFVCPFLVFLNLSVIVGNGKADIIQVAPICFFVMAFIKAYVECIIPKVPRVRRELKLATVSAGL